VSRFDEKGHRVVLRVPADRTDIRPIQSWLRYNEVVPKVTFLPEGRTVEFESGSLPYGEHGKPESLLDVAEHFDIHLEHACGGSCACTTCHVIVKDGTDGNLTEMDDDG